MKALLSDLNYGAKKEAYKEAELDLLEALRIKPNDPDIVAEYGKLINSLKVVLITC